MDIQTTSEDRSWKEKITAKVSDARVAVAGLKPRMIAMSMKATSSIRTNPARWAGIAVGAGLGIGLIGRFLKHRARDRRMPAVVIIEAC